MLLAAVLGGTVAVLAGLVLSVLCVSRRRRRGRESEAYLAPDDTLPEIANPVHGFASSWTSKFTGSMRQAPLSNSWLLGVAGAPTDESGTDDSKLTVGATYPSTVLIPDEDLLMSRKLTSEHATRALTSDGRMGAFVFCQHPHDDMKLQLIVNVTGTAINQKSPGAMIGPVLQEVIELTRLGTTGFAMPNGSTHACLSHVVDANTRQHPSVPVPLTVCCSHGF